MFLAISTASFTAGFTIRVNSSLESWKSAIPFLWTLSGSFLLLAIYLAFFKIPDEHSLAIAKERKEAIRKSIRDLRREYREMHHVSGGFTLGPEYYIERMTGADPTLVYEIIQTEGEKG